MTIKSNTPPEEKDEARTPEYLYRFANSIWNFDLDLASSDANTKCRSHFTKDLDALSLPWPDYGTSGWCNPPYSNISPWLEKAALHRHDLQTVFLIPTPNGEAMYRIIEQMASEIILIHGRISFLRPSGEKMTGNTRGSCLVVFNQVKGCKLSWLDRNELEEKYG